MRRFQITGDDDHLSLTLTPGLQRIIPGCMMLGFTFICVTLLGVLAIIKGDVNAAVHDSAGDLNFLSPRGNHFGFLWLTTTLLAAVLTPLYATKVILAPIVFRFDRRTGLFTRCGKKVAPLGKVEGVRIYHADDPDNRTLHKLAVIHTDGFETPLDNWYDEREISFVGGIIAEFCGVKLRGVREDHFEDGGMVSRNEGLSN
jgi:hypothetical protein